MFEGQDAGNQGGYSLVHYLGYGVEEIIAELDSPGRKSWRYRSRWRMAMVHRMNGGDRMDRVN